MFAPGAASLAKEFHITSSTIASLTVSIYLCGFAVGPMFIAPLSELYGRLVDLSHLQCHLHWLHHRMCAGQEHRHVSRFSIPCRMCFFGPIDSWRRNRRRRRPASSAWEGNVSVLRGTTSGTSRWHCPTQTVMTLTMLQGLGPNCWWLCVRINWLAMDFLDHRNPSE